MNIFKLIALALALMQGGSLIYFLLVYKSDNEPFIIALVVAAFVYIIALFTD